MAVFLNINKVGIINNYSRYQYVIDSDNHNDTYYFIDTHKKENEIYFIIDQITYDYEYWKNLNGFYLVHAEMVKRRYNEDFMLYDSVLRDYLIKN